MPSTFLGLMDLWVINVSYALSGKDVVCNGGDPNCLRLTSTLGSSNAQQPFSLHGFFGDSLIYYASDNNGGRPAYVWRPGWPTAKLLAAEAALLCTGDAKGASAYCLGNVDDHTSVATQVSTDIFAGAIGDGSKPLAKIGTAIIAVDPETSITNFQVALSPAGDWIAWSARPTAGGVETLNAQKIGDPTTRQVIAEDVTQWAFSHDGQSLFWLRSFSDVTFEGTLEMASFPPAGGAPVTAATLMVSVASYREAGDKGLVVLHDLDLSSGAGDLSIIADRGAPLAVTAVDSNVVGFMDVSRDGRAVLYAKNDQMDPVFGTSTFFFDVHLGGPALQAPCTLANMALSPNVAGFSSSGEDAVWIAIDKRTGQAVGNLTRTATCASQVFSPDLWQWTFVGGEGIVYVENGAANQSNGVDVTLKYGTFTDGALPSSGTATTTTEIQERALLTYASLAPAYPAVVFTVYVGDSVDGLYVSAPLPFTAAHPLPPGGGGPPSGDGGGADAGATDTGNADAGNG